MSDPVPEEQRQLAVRIASSASQSEREALSRWVEALLQIRESDLSILEQAKKAVTVTADSSVILPAIALISRELIPEEFSQLTERLLEIRDSDKSVTEKLTEATSLALEQIKKFAWDDRGLVGRAALGGAVAGAVLFGGQGAGIAALGTAIGVPLWVVFGAGAAFAGVLYEEITGARPNPKTIYTTIEAEHDESE